MRWWNFAAWALALVYLVVALAAFGQEPVAGAFLLLTAAAVCPYTRSMGSVRSVWKRRRPVGGPSLFAPDDEFVYVVSNDAFEAGIFKVGMTTQLPRERVNQLNSATGVPQPFVIDVLVAAKDSRALEGLIHRKFSSRRVNDNREFFRLSKDDVLWLVETYRTVYVNHDHVRTKHGFELPGVVLRREHATS